MLLTILVILSFSPIPGKQFSWVQKNTSACSQLSLSPAAVLSPSLSLVTAYTVCSAPRGVTRLPRTRGQHTVSAWESHK